MLITRVKYFFKNNRLTENLYEKLRQKIMVKSTKKKNMSLLKLNPWELAEVREVVPREIRLNNNQVRCNLLINSVDAKHVFGGVTTALKFFEEFCDFCGVYRRIIVFDAPVNPETMINLDKYQIVAAEEDSQQDYQLLPFYDRAGRSLAVAEHDIFLATAWWTAYIIQPVMKWQKKIYCHSRYNLLYFIQDYEPGFYAWSSMYMLAESTYKMDIPVTAIFNSKELHDYMVDMGYQFHDKFYFRPLLNQSLKKYLFEYKGVIKRKNQILVYGRPSVARNAFEVIVAALRLWCKQDCSQGWEVIAAGEDFADVGIGDEKVLRSIGKVSLEEYAKIMLETKIGISLMISPHPSYPPLEMSTFGIKVITNTYANKDLSSFNSNIIAMNNCSGDAIASKLSELCSGDIDNQLVLDNDYVSGEQVWEEIFEDLAKGLQI